MIFCEENVKFDIDEIFQQFSFKNAYNCIY